MSVDEKEIAPVDIVFEILKKIPIKSIMKFMPVSKQWKSIIQSSSFIADYNRSHIQPPNKFFVDYYYGPYADDTKYDVDIFNDDDLGFLQRLTLPLPDIIIYWLIGYSQGLFEIRCRLPKDVFVIWNPSIRKSVCIPLPEPSWDDLGFTVCNATDPTVFIVTYKQHNICAVKIFSLGTGDWRTLSDAPYRESLELYSMWVIDGFIHWVAFDRTPEGVVLRNMILTFDLTNEQFTELSLPPNLASPTSNANLDLSKLRESLVVLERYERRQEIGVWMMMMEREPGSVRNSFTKLFTVNIPPHVSVAIHKLDVLGFTIDGQPIIQWDVRSRTLYPCERKLVIYGPQSKCFKDIGILEKSYSRLAGSYMETLLLLDH